MGRIKLLPENVVNRIAAGEVITRPASVVKELMENAIDAGATEIKVKVWGGGKDKIIVEDNGCGMDEKDIALAIQRHATSKISSAEDIYRVRTYGFRGEALAAIAGVSRLEIVSRPHEFISGNRLYAEGGKIITLEPTSCPAGTIIVVTDLFFNVPARRKFLKSDSVEMARIVEEWIRIAIPYFHVRFSLYVDGKERFILTPENSLSGRIAGIFGRKLLTGLLPFEHRDGLVHLWGFVGRPEIAKKTRPPQYLFVNSRYFQDISFKNYVYLAYGSSLPPNHHPPFFVFLEVPPEDIDVNVHPAKIEVAFKNKLYLCRLLESLVKYTLGRIPSIDFRYASIEKALISVSNIHLTQEEIIPVFEKKLSPELFPTLPDATGKGEGDVPVGGPFVISCVLQLHKKYIFAVVNGSPVLVNQHRAHLRILYEKYLALLSGGENVFPIRRGPLVLEVSQDTLQKILSIKHVLSRFGYSVEEFGRDAIVVHSYPSVFLFREDETSMTALFSALATEEVAEASMEEIALGIAHCQSVKEGAALREDEMRYLLKELFNTSEPHLSPDGHPIFITLKPEDIDFLFKRSLKKV